MNSKVISGCLYFLLVLGLFGNGMAFGQNTPEYGENQTAVEQTVQTLDNEAVRSSNNAGAFEMPVRTFQAAGREWCVGSNCISWDDSVKWILSLDDGWDIPTRQDLQELYKEVQSNSPIGDESAWADACEPPSDKSYYVEFWDGKAYFRDRDHTAPGFFAVAVRKPK